MKKIVALVLTLVLALSLATVAFAGTTTYVKDSAGHKLLEVNSILTAITAEQIREASPENNLVALYQINLSFKGGAKVPMLGTYVLASSDDYDLVLVSGKDITYLSQNAWGAYSGEATPIKSTWAGSVSKLTCGEYITAAKDTSLYEFDGKVWKAESLNLWDDYTLKALLKDTTARMVLVDGELVCLFPAYEGGLTVTYVAKTGKIDKVEVTKDYAVVGHAYTADTKNVGGVSEITKVYCVNCGAEFEFVIGSENDAIKAFGAGNYACITGELLKVDKYGNFVYSTVDFVNGDVLFADSNVEAALDGDDLWIKTAEMEGTTPADGSDNTKVKSGDTFDAGVALYAGMALMSVAGSAVVIGKKKEF